MNLRLWRLGLLAQAAGLVAPTYRRVPADPFGGPSGRGGGEGGGNGGSRGGPPPPTPPNPAGNNRAQVIVVRQRPHTRDLTRPELDPTPIFTPSGGDPIVGGTGGQGPQSNAAQREMTVNAAEGVVPVQFGGPLPVGGYVIGFKQYNGFTYVHFALGEGPSRSGGITAITLGGRAVGALGIGPEIHYGTAGDTTSTLMTEAIPSYTFPKFIVGVVMKCPAPNSVTGDYNPLDFKCQWSGTQCFNPDTLATEDTNNPIIHIHEAFRNATFGMEQGNARFKATEFADMINGCDVDIGGGVKRYEMVMRCDQQDDFGSWLKVWRAHCAAVINFNDGKWGGFLDLPRSRVLDGLGNPFVLTDWGDAPNLGAEPTPSYRGRSDKPTVVIAHYTDAANAFVDASVMIPDGGPAAGLPWIPLDFVVKGCMTAERARRLGTFVYNRLQLNVDIPLTMFQAGMKLLPGDRIGLDSRRIIFDPSEVVDNVGAVAGVEEITIAKLIITGAGAITAQAVLYRDATYGDVIDTSGNPTPPPPIDPYTTPDDPTGVVAPHASADQYGQLEFAPALDPYIGYYEVTDLFGDPAEPPVVATILKTQPINADGKYHTFIPQAVHLTGGTVRSMKVRVKSVTEPAHRKSPGVTVSWDSTSGTPHTKTIYGKAVTLYETASGTSLASIWSAANPITPHHKIVDTAKVGNFWEDLGGGTFLLNRNRTVLEFAPGGVLPADAVITDAFVSMYVKVGTSGDDVEVHLMEAVNFGGVVYDFGTPPPAFTSSTWFDHDWGTFLTHLPLANGYVQVDIPLSLLTPFPPAILQFVMMVPSDISGLFPGFDGDNVVEFDGSNGIPPGPRLTITYTSATEDAGSGDPAITFQTPAIVGQQIPGGLWTGEVRGDSFTRTDGKRVLVAEGNVQATLLECTQTSISTGVYTIPGSDNWIASTIQVYINGQAFLKSSSSPITTNATGYSVSGAGNRTITILLGDGRYAASDSIAITGIKDIDA